MSLRFERTPVCAECLKYKATCGTGTACNIVKKKLRSYHGIRPTADGFDCALPLSIDSHTACSFGCLYCFTPNLMQGRNKTLKPVGQTSLKFIEGIFSGKKGKQFEHFRKMLKYDNRNAQGYPCPVQCGALSDPFDNIERNQGWTLKFIELAKKYNQPVRFSTKGNLFLIDEYIEAMKEKPHLFWVAFSIISSDDEIIKQIDKRAPPTSERIECMRRLSEIGVKTSLRFRPMIPGISDSTKNHPQAWKELIDMVADAGAVAISVETVFMPGGMTKDLKEKWQEIEKISGKPLIKIYKSFGKNQSCIRPSYKWTEEIITKIVKHAKKRGLYIGVSSPDWKQLNDFGCCCGIPPFDPVFGNWQRENATNALVRARDGELKEISSKDIIPPWAYDYPLLGVVNMGVGPKTVYDKHHLTWADKLKDTWNTVDKQRSPLNYFQGALKPIRIEGKEVIYK
jgi:DNA repair photolyase